MSKSKHSPALFEVIGNKPEYTQGKNAGDQNTGEGSTDTSAVASGGQEGKPSPEDVKPVGKPKRSAVGTQRENSDTQQENSDTRLENRGRTANASEQQQSTTGSALRGSGSVGSGSGGPVSTGSGSGGVGAVQAVPRPRPMVSPQRAGQTQTVGIQAAALAREVLQGRDRILDVRGGRFFLSLNTANGMIVAGCVFLTLFAVYLLGYRSGTHSGSAEVGDIQQHLDEITAARRKAANPSVLQMETARRGSGSSEAANPAQSGKSSAARTRRTRSNAPVAIKGAPSRAIGASEAKAGAVLKPVTANLAEDPRVPGQTYIVVEYFPKSPDHDALAECRHVAGYLAENRIDAFIVSGEKGYQLVTRKGFTYSTQREACLAYKQRIRKLAKGYKPLDRTYMFIGFEKTHRPKE